jgi:putative membrane protein
MMKRITPIPGLLPVFFSATAVAQQQPGFYHGPGMMWNGGWFGMIIGLLMTIFFVAAVVVLVVAATRWFQSSGSQQRSYPPAEPGTKTALDILKERFARGEIDKAENGVST